MDKFTYFFPFIFIGMWVLVSFILSRKAWNKLVEKFRTDAPFDGNRIGIISADINSVSYKNSLILKCNQQGIYLKTTFLFRLFHLPVLIPWKEIKETRDGKVLFIRTKELVIGNPFIAMITIKASVYEKMERYLGSIPKG
jgi:hypothetical protein